MKQTKAQLITHIDQLQASLHTAHDQQRNERALRQNAEKEVTDIRKQFADLKERLHRAELQNAENEGYLRRVREDDNVTDPLVEIEGPEGKRFVNKRHPSITANYSPSLHDSYNEWIGKENKKHWVNY